MEDHVSPAPEGRRKISAEEQSAVWLTQEQQQLKDSVWNSRFIW